MNTSRELKKKRLKETSSDQSLNVQRISILHSLAKYSFGLKYFEKLSHMSIPISKIYIDIKNSFHFSRQQQQQEKTCNEPPGSNITNPVTYIKFYNCPKRCNGYYADNMSTLQHTHVCWSRYTHEIRFYKSRG